LNDQQQAIVSISNDNNNTCIINGLDDVGDPNNNNNTTNNNNNSISVRSVDNGVVEFNFCPYCGVATDRISGCNFMDCAIGGQIGNAHRKDNRTRMSRSMVFCVAD